MTETATVRFIIEELIKVRRKCAPEAHIYEVTKDINMKRFYDWYQEYTEAIKFMEMLLVNKRLL